MAKTRVGIVGATGYTGMELLRLLGDHPSVQITLATSEKYSGKKLSTVFPYFQSKLDLTLQALEDKTVIKNCDIAFSCLPHMQAAKHVAAWIQGGIKVIDLSADFRLRTSSDYKQWYGENHPEPALLKEAVYGLPETHRSEIKKARLIGNPGCYPTGAILSLTPLLKEKIIDASSIIIDSKSGVSGAGRSAVLESLYSEVNESIHAYKVGRHRHTGEIEQELSRAAGKKVIISFTPHLVPMDRGILSTIYVQTTGKIDTAGLLKCISGFYKKEPFVRVLPEGVFPKTKEVRGTNFCAIGAYFDPRTKRAVIIAAIDNLLKGASSQAVQNMNILLGVEETTGLFQGPLVP